MDKLHDFVLGKNRLVAGLFLYPVFLYPVSSVLILHYRPPSPGECYLTSIQSVCLTVSWGNWKLNKNSGVRSENMKTCLEAVRSITLFLIHSWKIIDQFVMCQNNTLLPGQVLTLESLWLWVTDKTWPIQWRQHKGASIYDVRSGWGEGGPQKADERNKISWFVTVIRGEGSKNPRILWTSCMESPNVDSLNP